MRFAPVSLALSCVFAITASVSHSQAPVALSPRAAALEAAGKASLGAGDAEGAVNAFEAALAVQPDASPLVLDMALAARQQGLQGKAIHYYRAVLAQEPANLEAIAGEGAALAEKGALDKARHDLARLQTLCGADCAEAHGLALEIDRHAASATQAGQVAAAALAPEARVSVN